MSIAGKVLLAVRNPRLFLIRLYNYMRQRLYVNETLILFQHETATEQKAPVEIRYASPETIRDILSFQPERYVKVVHRSWVKHTPQTVRLHACLPMRLQENEAFIHYCETAPQARGKNIYPHVLTKIADDFKDRKRTFVAVNAKNVGSIKGIEKAGFKEAGRWKLLVLLGIRIRPFRMPLIVI